MQACLYFALCSSLCHCFTFSTDWLKEPPPRLDAQQCGRLWLNETFIFDCFTLFFYSSVLAKIFTTQWTKGNQQKSWRIGLVEKGDQRSVRTPRYSIIQVLGIHSGLGRVHGLSLKAKEIAFLQKIRDKGMKFPLKDLDFLTHLNLKSKWTK